MFDVFVIAEPKIDRLELARFVEGREWKPDSSISDAELLCEIMGRLCYDSFDTSSNANLTKVRSGNADYMANIISSGHLSVLEHAQVSFIFTGVSRVFTHELVRHRVGVAISQESGRYVRLNVDEVPDLVIPQVEENEKEIVLRLCKVNDTIYKAYHEINAMLSKRELNMSEKKRLTSLIRRILPNGMPTKIGWSCNLRTLRHVIQLRTSPHAEAEIREVFSIVRDIAVERWPNLTKDL